MEMNTEDFPLSKTPVCEHPTINYRVHLPKLTQAVTGRNFHYFKLKLYDIHTFFKEKKHWNQNYEPAQMIYSDAPASAALRAAIHAEHAIIYSGRPCRDGSVEGEMPRDETSFFGLLNQYGDGKSAFSPIHSAVKATTEFLWGSDQVAKKEGNLRVYTYVLMDDTFRFSRCGAGRSVDLSSKHALHAGAEPEVYYAGEFWVETKTRRSEKRDPPVLYIDNNSGTFAPPKADLYRMKLLMEANFPGMKVVTLDYQDPEWKERRYPGAQ